MSAKTNNLLSNPPILRIIERDHTITYVFVGNVPATIARACTQGHGEILRKYYGNDWRKKLGLINSTSGGDDRAEIAALLKGAPQKSRRHGNRHIITSPSIYPEDNLMTLREKIWLATDIPPYRQHLLVNGAHTYDLYADVVVDVDISAAATYPDVVDGINIDRSIYVARDSIHVDVGETFAIVGDHADITCYDLANFIAPGTKIVGKYKIDLIYYGFVIKFWPMLTYECFIAYLNNEADLRANYPALARDHALLTTIFAEEAAIINAKYACITKAMLDHNHTISITQVVARVTSPGIRINIRNAFDKLKTSRCTPEIHAYLEHARRPYMLRKKHINTGSDITFPSIAAMKSGLTIAISLRSADQESFHHRKSISTIDSEQTRYMFLCVHANGMMTIRAVWNEEDEVIFDDLVKVLRRFVDPIINKINAVGNYIFASGQLPMLTRANMSLVSLGANIYWKKTISDIGFKEIKRILDQYIAAEIMGVREAAPSKGYDLIFRKGMHEFDPALFTSMFSLSNQYEYITNKPARAKWEQFYSGRNIRITNRTTDVRFEIFDSRESEFQIFLNYVAAFTYGVKDNPKLAAKTHHAQEKKLLRLREMDPNLYNLKKHGGKRTYSILCQLPHQPLIYTNEEIDQMRASDRAKLTKYWNFTTNKEVYYGCPNDEFPYLSFIAGMHPLGYCLPCCNKRNQSSARSDVYDTCLREHKYDHRDMAGTHGNHVLNYGKDLKEGQLSKISYAMSKVLPWPLYICGVKQSVPGINHAGTVFALAAALGITAAVFIQSCLNAIEQDDGLLFGSMIFGTLPNYFATFAELGMLIKEVFLGSRQLLFNRFIKWADLFIEFAEILHDVAVIVLIDIDRKGENIDVCISRIAAANIILMKCKNRVYPMMYMGDPRMYIFAADHPVIKLFTADNIAPPVEQSVKEMLINRRNKCYAMIVEYENVRICYPIEPTIYSRTDIPLRFSPMTDADRAPIDTAKEFLQRQGQEWEQIGAYLKTTSGLMPVHADAGPIPISEINELIFANAPPTPDNRAKLLPKALYANNIYRLYVMEFIAFCNGERNLPMRERIKHALATGAPLSSLNLCESDLLKISSTQIDASVYKFDSITRSRLAQLDDRDAIFVELMRISPQFCIEEPRGELSENLFIPCSRDSGAVCNGGKLIVNNIAECASILAAELSSMKEPVLDRIFNKSALDWFKFEKSATDVITIYEM